MNKFLIVHKKNSDVFPSYTLRRLIEKVKLAYPATTSETLKEVPPASIHALITEPGKVSIGITNEVFSLLNLATTIRAFLTKNCQYIVLYESSIANQLITEIRDDYSIIKTADIVSGELEEAFTENLSMLQLLQLIQELSAGKGIMES